MKVVFWLQVATGVLQILVFVNMLYLARSWRRLYRIAIARIERLEKR
jgi:hypothetical protein